MIGAVAAAENVFPPVPADTAVALGAFLSSGGRVSAWSVFLITWLANVTGATAVYAAGRTLGRPFFAGRLGRRLLQPERLARLEGLYSRYGVWVIFVSRFIPGVRAVVPPFAGVAGIGVLRTVIPMAAASGIWYGTLTYLAATVVSRLDEVTALVGRFSLSALVAALLVVAAAGLVWWLRRRRVPP